MYSYKINHKVIKGDIHTPVSIYLTIRDLYNQSALLECGDYHSHENNKSYIGFCPIADISISHGKSKLCYPDKKTVTCEISEKYTVEKSINEFLNEFKFEGKYKETCGLYGYTTFNAVRYFEGIDIKDYTADKHDAPDMFYVLFKYTVIFNDFNHEIVILELLENDEKSRLDEINDKINSRNFSIFDFKTVGETTSTLTDEEHKENIRRGIKHCLAGDVFQIVLSRRFIQKFKGDDFEVYRNLRSINPSPYLFYFDFGGFRIFGSSPETHCKITNRFAYIDPIAGTAKRTGCDTEDKASAESLLNNPKENAEHVMLVDLARNDLSRNCDNVRVLKFRETQYYSHVIHLVSRVGGQLQPTADPIKSFTDTFPAGTLSGAPKVRAMQLISEIEPHNRGAYGGCIGFIGFNGDVNQAITIRTFVSRNNELWFQAGGGIVAKSDPEYELQEVNNKLGALKKAIENS